MQEVDKEMFEKQIQVYLDEVKVCTDGESTSKLSEMSSDPEDADITASYHMTMKIMDILENCTKHSKAI